MCAVEGSSVYYPLDAVYVCGGGVKCVLSLKYCIYVCGGGVGFVYDYKRYRIHMTRVTFVALFK